MENLFSLASKVALVTGATEGIGRAIALGFANQGADVVAIGRNAEGLRTLREEVAARGRQFFELRVDLANVAEIRPMVHAAIDRMGKIDILVNVAACFTHKPAEEITEEDWDDVMDLNVKSLFFCCQEVGRTMLMRGGGRIINVSSNAAYRGSSQRCSYAASKAAVSNLTRTLAVEWSGRGVLVNAIAPGPVQTPSREQFFSNPTIQEKVRAGLPVGRIGVPEDLVGPAIFLASEASRYVTGTTLVADGGVIA